MKFATLLLSAAAFIAASAGLDVSFEMHSSNTTSPSEGLSIPSRLATHPETTSLTERILEEPAVITTNEVLITAPRPRKPKTMLASAPVEEPKWVCSVWKDSLAGGQYKDCGWK